MKREYFILSGFCAFLIGSVLYFTYETANPRNFILFLLIPSLLTFAPMLGILQDRNGNKPGLPYILPVGARLLLMFFQLLLVLYQFLMVIAWIISFREWPVAADVQFMGYFFLVGMVCSLTMLYRLAQPGEAAGC